MARFFDVHPKDPNPRAIAQVVGILRDGGLIAYPTDSGYALGCTLGNAEGKERIATIRRLDERHHYTLVCRDFAQLGQLVHIDNAVFRAIKAATPGDVRRWAVVLVWLVWELRCLAYAIEGLVRVDYFRRVFANNSIND